MNEPLWNWSSLSVSPLLLATIFFARCNDLAKIVSDVKPQPGPRHLRKRRSRRLIGTNITLAQLVLPKPAESLRFERPRWSHSALLRLHIAVAQIADPISKGDFTRCV